MPATIHECAEDLLKIYNKLGHSQSRMFRLAPVYLVSCDEYSENLHEQLYFLYEDMIEKGLFAVSTSTYHELFFSEDGANRQEIFLSDHNHRNNFPFKTWMQQITYSGSVKGGIVNIFLQDDTMMPGSELPYKSLFRQMEAYKDRFLFFLFVSKKNKPAAEELLSKSVFSMTVSYKEPSPEDYLTAFIHKLSDYGIRHTKEAEDMLLEILEREHTHLSMAVLDRAVKEIAWKLLLNDKKQLKDLLSEGTLEKYTKTEATPTKTSIGFVHEVVS